MSEKSIQRNNGGDSTGKLSIVGIGPSGKEDRTHRADKAILESSIVVGYKRYLDNVADLTDGKELISSGMTKEADRCKEAIDAAVAGATVALVSSGDAGVYGMAGLVMEILHDDNISLEIDVIPGASAANSAAARLGAPLMLDYATISLSDLLVPWEDIRKRLEAVAEANFAVALYNPRSRKRVEQLKEAAEIFRKYRSGSTPVGVCTAVGYEGEEKIIISDLDNFEQEDIGMMTTVVIGNSDTKMMGDWMVTPRGYKGVRI